MSFRVFGRLFRGLAVLSIVAAFYPPYSLSVAIVFFFIGAVAAIISAMCYQVESMIDSIEGPVEESILDASKDQKIDAEETG